MRGTRESKSLCLQAWSIWKCSGLQSSDKCHFDLITCVLNLAMLKSGVFDTYLVIFDYPVVERQLCVPSSQEVTRKLFQSSETTSGPLSANVSLKSIFRLVKYSRKSAPERRHVPYAPVMCAACGQLSPHSNKQNVVYQTEAMTGCAEIKTILFAWQKAFMTGFSDCVDRDSAAIKHSLGLEVILQILDLCWAGLCVCQYPRHANGLFDLIIDVGLCNVNY